VSRSGKIYKFGRFQLDTGECLLWCEGDRVPLEPQVYRTLLALVENSQHLSRRDWLLEQVWGDTHVEEGGLTRNISVLRRVLGEGYIETVPKRGYRFVAETAEMHPGTGSADAYQAYITGRYHWSQRSEAGLRKATEYFAQAIAADPAYARAYSGLADAYAALGYLSHVAPKDAFPKAKEAATRALQLDPVLTEPHTSLAYVSLYYDWDWTAAETAFRRAIALNRNYATAHHWYAVYLTAMGRFEEALASIRQSQALDPTSLIINTDVGFVLYYSRRYEEAIRQLQTVSEMNPHFPLAHLWLGRAYQEMQKYEEAVAEFRRTEAVLREWPVLKAAIGHVQGAAGWKHAALETLDELKRLSGERYVTPYGIALVHAGLGEMDEALLWLQRALEDRAHWLVWLKLDPRFDGLRSERVFGDVLKRVGGP
jgi:DNA-binding winged helix-turn-helix (wHTH) protein